MSPALLALVLPALADTGVVDCRDWVVVPDEVSAFTDLEQRFRVVTPNWCQVGTECTWHLTEALGALDAETGLSVIWTAPHDPPPNCNPLMTSLVATCTLWETDTRNSTADITLRCTEEQRRALEEERAAHSPQGGGCGAASPAEALLLLPLGVWGVRRRLGREAPPGKKSGPRGR
jgi:hypothetical protein